MEKKLYERPSAEVVELRHTGMLMTSDDNVKRLDYGKANEQTWGDS